ERRGGRFACYGTGWKGSAWTKSWRGSERESADASAGRGSGRPADPELATLQEGRAATLRPMRWATFADRQGRERVGLAVGDALHALEPEVRLVDLLGDEGERLNEAGERLRAHPNEVFDI